MLKLRATVLTIACVVALSFNVDIADAHQVSGIGASNFKTTLKSVEPGLPTGAQLEILDSGDQVRLSNPTDSELVVRGYSDEPYLRISRSGGWVNRRSPSYFQNQTRYATGSIPSTADASAEPDWSKISDSSTVQWHDHRVHWMTPQPPPLVAAKPNSFHSVIPRWEIPISTNSERLVASGSLDWVPAKSHLWQWLLTSTILAIAVGALPKPSRHVRLIGVILCALVTIDVVHTFGLTFGSSASTAKQLQDFATNSYYSPVTWIAAGVCIWFFTRRRVADAAFALIFVGGAIALVSGVSDISSLDKSQLVFAFPTWVSRISIAASIGLGFGLVAIAIRLLIHVRSTHHLRASE